MDLSSVIDSLATGTYVVTRTGDTTAYTNGVADNPGGQSTFSIVASVQPASGRDLRRLPEGLDVFEIRVIFTKTLLRTAVYQGAPPDTLEIDGETYQVQTVDRWAESGNYWRVLAAVV